MQLKKIKLFYLNKNFECSKQSLQDFLNKIYRICTEKQILQNVKNIIASLEMFRCSKNTITDVEFEKLCDF